MGVEVWLHAFSTSALDAGKWSASRPVRFTARRSPQYPLDRRLGGPQRRSTTEKMHTLTQVVNELQENNKHISALFSGK
jgi:hypothetical protein